MSDLKILLLEDNPTDIVLVKKELGKLGLHHTLRAASNSIEFREMVNDELPDLVVSDHFLPDYDSFSAHEHLNKLKPNVPFIIISDHISEKIAQKASELGINDYLSKQYLYRLPETIRRTLYLWQKRQPKDKLGKAQRPEYTSTKKYSHILWANQAIDGKYLYVSPKCADILGYNFKELTGSYAFAYVHPDDKAIVEKTHLKILGNKKRATVKYRFRKSDGKYIWVTAKYQPILQKNTNEVINIIVNIQGVDSGSNGV